MQNLTEALTEVKPARIGYFTIRGSGERSPLGYRCAGVNLAVAVSVGAGGCVSGGGRGPLSAEAPTPPWFRKRATRYQGSV